MKIAFSTLGCKLNFAESSAIGKALLGEGYVRAKQGEEADVVVLNTCSVTDAADHKGRQAIHRLRRQHPQAVLIVTGCYAELKGQEIAAMPEVDYVVGANEKERVVEIVKTLPNPPYKGGGWNEGPECCSLLRREGWGGSSFFFPACSWDDRTRCFLKVQDGCNYFCTYCTIPLARGRSRNASIADIVSQAAQALRDGAKEIVLTGVNIGDFGRSTGERFIDLLKALDRLEETGTLPNPPYKGGSRENSSDSETSEKKVISLSSCVLHPLSQESPCSLFLAPCSTNYRIRISSCEPNLLTDEVIDFVANSKHFAPHFHIPLQSGSNEVLKIMHRHYDRELFAERVAHIRERMPNAFIGVDCMVGVRGETEERWKDYLAFVKQLDVSQLHVFTYSERANTRMLEMDLYVVPKKERERRSKILHAVSDEKLQAFYAKHQGEEATVLWEGKKEDGMMAGFTENYIKVHAPYDKAKVNTFEVVRI